jgi:hypothetical protein
MKDDESADEEKTKIDPQMTQMVADQERWWN